MMITMLECHRLNCHFTGQTFTGCTVSVQATSKNMKPLHTNYSVFFRPLDRYPMLKYIVHDTDYRHSHRQLDFHWLRP